MRKSLLFCFFLFIVQLVSAQETFPVNGSFDKRPQQFALTNATIVVNSEKRIENATLLIKGQHIEAVGKNVTVPKGYAIIDLQGKHVYPSFIDAFNTYGLPEIKPVERSGGRSTPVMQSSKPGATGWNEAIAPETKAVNLFSINREKAAELKKLGFGVVQSVNRNGIARGSAVLTSLATLSENEVVLRPEVAAHYSFSKGTASTDYPSSLMGSIALLRQTYYDADWYGRQTREYNVSLQEFNRLQSLPQVFEASDALDVLRANQVAREFGKSYIMKTGGNEYQRIEEIKATGAALIVPLNYPKAYDVEDPLSAARVSLSQLKHWELAPANAAALERAGIVFAITLDGLEKTSDFWPNIRKAIEHGLSEKQALKSLTEVPASLLQVSDLMGTIEKGKLANLIISSGNLFEEDNTIYETWVQGERFIGRSSASEGIHGEYATTIPGIGAATLSISGKPGQLEASIAKAGDSTKTKGRISANGALYTLSFNLKGTGGATRMSAYATEDSPKSLKGEVTLPDGTSSPWEARYSKSVTAENKKSNENKKQLIEGRVTYPFLSYGNEELPRAQTVLFKNATVWSNEEQGIMKATDVLIEGGKIKAIGQNLSAGNALVIDGTGKHLTPGIIDEHSHIAISRGVNEGTQAVTSEVRIGDVINSEDINIYRQLAGGVTTSHLLHGSANPIGGQSQLIKLRWGRSPEELKFQGSARFIKFALGENVKQSNWGIAGVRFPQTRMGVEQVFIDAFTRAKEYQEALGRKGSLVRRDLELDALVEILNDERFITCHSYVQSEINMLMDVADRMGFKINTFTHILEGYKVADKMSERNIAGSTFADWWAYKVEVSDAIPYNAYLMHSQGVLTGINSDDAEMARRLNQEAAKIVKYGGISEEEAFKMVTLNPAKMMHIDDRVGSIKAGKDADLVLWSDNPLSIYARAEKTYVDGVKYWDIEEDEARQKDLAQERARLIQKSLDSKKSGSATQRAESKPSMLYHCETMEDFTILD